MTKTTVIRKKKGGMYEGPFDVIGQGDTGCIFQDKHKKLYKMIVPRGDHEVPAEVGVVHRLHVEKKLDDDIFVYPSEYKKISVTEIAPILDTIKCRDVKSTLAHFKPSHVYIAAMKYAGVSIADLRHMEHFPKFTVDEVFDILQQLEYILVMLKNSHIIHGDLHEGNITLTGWEGHPGQRKHLRAHVIDFGLMQFNIKDSLNDQESMVKKVVIPLFKEDLVSNDVLKLRRAIDTTSMLTTNIIKLHQEDEKNQKKARSPLSSDVSHRSNASHHPLPLISPMKRMPPMIIPAEHAISLPPPSKVAKKFDIEGSAKKLFGSGKTSPKVKTKVSDASKKKSKKSTSS